VAEGAERLREQPPQLLDRLRLAGVLGEVDVYEFAQPRCLDEALLASESPFSSNTWPHCVIASTSSIDS
jgi:hypothetical protein